LINCLISIVLLVFLLIPSEVLAHPVDAIDADQVKSRAEVHIEADRIRLILEIDKSDAALFNRLLPADWLFNAEAFLFFDFGYAAAMSFVLLVLTNMISVVYIRLLQAEK
jgi:hypothetical protein